MGGLGGSRDRQIQELTGQPSQTVSQVGEGQRHSLVSEEVKLDELSLIPGSHMVGMN